MLQLRHQTQLDPAVEEHTCRLLNRAAGLRLPELFANDHANALYHLPNRHGVSVIALRTTSLSPSQLTQILTYRLAQYVLADFIDLEVLYQLRLEHEPLSSVSPDDIHVIAGAPETGQILCYAVLRASGAASGAATLRTYERPLFPVEQMFGWGIYNGLKTLPDLPVGRVLELSRFVKNQQLSTGNEQGVRSPVEVCVALHRVLCGPLMREVAAVIGDIEEAGAKRNLEFFHVPTVVIRGVVPAVTENHNLYKALQCRRFYPFVFLVADLALQQARLTAVERALDLPGEQAIRALLALKRTIQVARSSLEPPKGLVSHSNG